MRSTFAVACGVVLPLLCACGGAGAGPAPAPAGGEPPEAIVKKSMEAMKANDVNAYVACMASAEQEDARKTFKPLEAGAKADYEVGTAQIDGNQAKVPMKLIATDNSRPPANIFFYCIKEAGGWKITEVPFRAAEGRAGVGVLKDRLRVKYVQNDNKLPKDLTVEKLASLDALKGKWYGTYKLDVKGSSDNGYQGTTITAEPLAAGGAPVVTLTLKDIKTGDATVTPAGE